MYALIDSNNFFVSCERLFRPELHTIPTIVLSSNDGCAISRSSEAKALGIVMGEPVFKLKSRFHVIAGNDRAAWHAWHIQAAHAKSPAPPLAVFSANFELYGDISERITALLTSITPHIEVYSVDESFLDLSELPIPDYAAWGRHLHQNILRSVGIPVSVGIAPTKTLCKAANHYAKKHAEHGGAVYLNPLESDEQADAGEILHQTPVADVWGVGRRLSPKLRAEGIHTAGDLADMLPRHAQQLMGIHGRHMVYELNGIRCLPLQLNHKPQQMIGRGRQFGMDTNDLAVIEAAIASLCAKAAKQLRHERRLATKAAITLSTNRLKPNYRRIFIPVHLYTPTADTGILCSNLARALYQYHQARHAPTALYHKADVMLYDLVGRASLQTDLFGSVDIAAHIKSTRRMQTFDTLNTRYGPGTLRYATETLSSAWYPRKNMASPHYTTDWQDIPSIRLLQCYL